MRKELCLRAVGTRALAGLAFLLALLAGALTASPGSVAQADTTFVQACEKKDKSALNEILDAAFVWIDSNGRRLSRTEVLEKLPAISNAGSEMESRTYGDTSVVRAIRGRMNVLRVWVKREAGWKAMLYQEVLQVEKSEPAGGKASVACMNPCETIPFRAQTQSEKDAIASWQGVMKAMAENDADAYAPLIAEEFSATDTYHDRPYNKVDRLSQISKQKASGARSSPPELLSAEMFDFGDAVMMVAKEQRPRAKSYFNTRMWVKRDARWQLLFSFNTRIE